MKAIIPLIVRRLPIPSIILFNTDPVEIDNTEKIARATAKVPWIFKFIRNMLKAQTPFNKKKMAIKKIDHCCFTKT